MPVYKDKKRGTYYFEVCYIDAFGKSARFKRRGFKTSALAKEAMRKFMDNRYNNVHKRYKFKELTEMFLNYKSKSLKKRTIVNYEYLFEKQFNPFFENVYVDRITIPMIEQWQTELLKNNYTNTYLKKIQTTMSALMRFAIRKDMIKSNPFEYVDNVKNVNERKKEMLFWTFDQFKDFNDYIKKFEDKLLFETLYWTGMRISELQSRKWSDLDFQNKCLFVHNNFDNKNKIITSTTKTGINRYIYLNDGLVKDLEKWHNICSDIDSFSDDCYIFGIYKPIPYKTVENKKNKYITEYNKTHEQQLPKIRIHDFRHSHVSLLINNGVDSFLIAERLGHSKDMVEKTYAHMFPDKKKEILNVLNKF